MKELIFRTTKLSLLLLVFTNCDNDNNSVSRNTESVEVVLDNGTPQYFSNNITATDYPLAPTSGFSCQFSISSENTSGNQFIMHFGKQTAPCPFTLTTPFSNTITGSLSSLFVVHGINFDDTAANNLNYTVTSFGSNVGDDIDITLSGTYFEVADLNPHTIAITIHVHRD